MKASGFSLIELMIVLIIIGVLTAVALPAYNSSIQKSNRSDGQSALMQIATRMESYFYTNKTYSTDLTDLGYTATTFSSDEGYYSVAVSAATAGCPITSCYALVATAQGRQAADGNLSLNSIGQKLPAEKW